MKIKQEHLVLENTGSYRKTIIKVLELENGDYYIQDIDTFKKISLEQFIQIILKLTYQKQVVCYESRNKIIG